MNIEISENSKKEEKIENLENQGEKDKNNGEEEQKNEEKDNQNENSTFEKISSVPIMMKCFLCQDYCNESVQTICCNKLFCKRHIIEEILKNFKCPSCHQRCELKDIIENKKISEDIKWYKKQLNELILGEM